MLASYKNLINFTAFTSDMDSQSKFQRIKDTLRIFVKRLKDYDDQ